MTDRTKLILLWSLVALVPLLLVIVGDRIFWSVTDRTPPDDSGGVRMMDVGITALPYLILAVWATIVVLRGPLGGGWLAGAGAGVLVSVALWGTYYWDGYRTWRNVEAGHGGGGANIGLGLLMLASPLLVGAVMAVVHRLAR